MPSPNIKLHKGDLSAGLDFGSAVAIDTETLGLKPHRDRLCVVQLSAGDGTAHLVQFDGSDYTAPNLKALLTAPHVLKIFHYARFDVAVLAKYLGVAVAPLYCTKIASKLVRTYTDRHGLKDLVGELVGIELSKQQQSSDWAAKTLSDQQKAPACTQGPPRRNARSRRPPRACRIRLSLPADQGRPRPRRLRGHGHLLPLSPRARQKSQRPATFDR
jgi:ribonuclease D